MKQRIVEKLNLMHQEHIVQYLDTLSENEQLQLLTQLEAIDLSVISHNTLTNSHKRLEPMSALTFTEINQNRSIYTRIGIQAIRENKIGAVLLAGGHGSRLGISYSKGMLNIGVEHDLYIFECLINNLLFIVRQTDVWIPLFVMTNSNNLLVVKDFFEKNDYFGYNSEYIYFYKQAELPALDLNGKLMLSKKDKILTAPNGNGSWYSSMINTGILQVVNKMKIEWLNVFSVDNVLQRIADPCFIGAVIESGKASGAKVVAKIVPEEKIGVICLEDGEPCIIEYSELNAEMKNRRNEDGTLKYKYGVILNYLFHVDKMEQTLSVKYPLHRVKKRIPFYNMEGQEIFPKIPNAYKYEYYIFDSIKTIGSFLAYEVERSKEFAPIKNKSGSDSVETAQELLRLNGIEI